MAIYTGVADANGDFNIPFSANYTGGQKVTVTAEKDGATKSIELNAPSEVTGGGAIQFSGNMLNFPSNIGVVTLTNQISGSIGNYAFASAANSGTMFRAATGLIVEGAVTEIGNYAFNGWASITEITLPNTVASIGSYAIASCSALVNFKFPDSLTTLGDRALEACSNLTSIEINQLITLIGSYAFRNCSKLAGNLVFPNTNLTIKFAAFSGTKITSVVMPRGTLDQQTFANCSLLSSVELGVGVTSVDANAFSGCVGLTELKVLATIPPTAGTNLLGSSGNTSVVIKVPAASLTAYQTATNWSAYASQMVGI